MRKGLTLIELMITIALFTLLTALILASVSYAKSKARDSRRMGDLKQISNALNLYYSTHNNFPIYNNIILNGTDGLTNDLTNEEFLPAPIIDPGSPSFDYRYNSSNGLDYTLTFCLETDSIQGYTKGCDPGNVIKP